MILVCDECHSRYVVPGHAIGPEGRRVRCTNCNYEWFQDGEAPHPIPEIFEQDDGDGDDETVREQAEIEPIPESVKPVPEGSSVPALPSGDEQGGESFTKRYLGYAAAACVFMAVIGGTVASKPVMVKLWPASTAFFDVLGMETAVKGEDLIFDQLKAVVTEDENGVRVLHVSAEVLNLSRKDSGVPYIQTSLVNQDGQKTDSWIETPDSDVIGPEGEMPFETSYPHISADVKEVNVRFVLGAAVESGTGTGTSTSTSEQHAE